MSVLPIIATAAQSGLGLYQRHLDYDASLDMLSRQEAINNRQADIANQRQWEFLHYQDPDAVMRRYIDAGLNPNLIYKQLDGSVPSAPMATSPSVSAPRAHLDASLMDNLLKEAQASRLDSASRNETEITQKQVENIMSQTNLTNQQAELVVTQSKLVSEQIPYTRELVSFLSERKKGQLLDNIFSESSMESRLGLLAENWKINQSQARNVDRYWASVILGNNRQADFYLSSSKLNYVQMDIARSLGRLYDSESAFYRNSAMGELQRNQLRQYSLQAAAAKGNDGKTLGFRQATADLRMTMVNLNYQKEVTRLLNKFGGTEHVFGLIESGTRSFSNLMDALSDLQSTTFGMTSGPGGIIRTGSRTGLFAKPLGSVK